MKRTGSQEMNEIATLSVEEIIEVARRENLTSKKIRSLLYHNGYDQATEFPKIREALGREVVAVSPKPQPQVDHQASLREQEDARRREAAEEAAEQARREREAQRAAAKAAIARGAVIWCDAAENTVTRVVNAYGRKAKFHNGGYRVGLLAETDAGEYEAREYNSRCPDQFAAECYAVLKAVELAADAGAATVTVRNDRIGGFEASTKRGYIGAKYLWVAAKLASDNDLTVTFDRCSGAENRADRVSRTEA